MRQEEVKGLDPGFGCTWRKKLSGAVDEIVLMATRGPQGGCVLLHTALANVAVGIEAAFQGDDLDLESLFGKQGDGLFGGIGSGGVRIEVHDDPRGVAAQQANLGFGEGRSAGSENVGETG